jgi:hypothetical protein
VLEENIRRKILDLLDRSEPLVVTTAGVARDTKHFSQCQGWIAEALNIIQQAVPMPNNPYRRKIENIGEGSSFNFPERVGSMAEILRALLPDIDAGLLADFGNRIRAETFDNFLDHAENYLREGRRMEAGVIAGVVFEDTVRRIYRDKVGEDKDQKLENLINTLASQGVITGQQSKQAKVASHVRTKATHAQWDEFDLAGVDDAIEITKVLLREHMGG